MFLFCQEVQKFINACEGLQFLLMQSEELTADEKSVVEISARALLASLAFDRVKLSG